MGLNHIALQVFGFSLFLPALLLTKGEFCLHFYKRKTNEEKIVYICLNYL